MVLVDAHVHYYPCYGLAAFLEGAVAGFARAIRPSDDPAGPVGCLLLAEGSADHHFRTFRDDAVHSSCGRWSFRPTAEACSVLACCDGEPKLIVVAGRQIVTDEELEVLALGCDCEFPDGRPVREVMDAARECGAIPVLPWGFGKWWFRRGAVVTDLIKSTAGHGLFLGDNGGRLRIGPRPALFQLAESKGIRILPGSDPLPFPRQARRAGGYGFRLDGSIEPDRPTGSIRHLLRDNPAQPETFGGLETLGHFIRNQAAMQLRKRLASRARYGTN